MGIVEVAGATIIEVRVTFVTVRPVVPDTGGGGRV
jgi:hypothetical protein